MVVCYSRQACTSAGKTTGREQRRLTVGVAGPAHPSLGNPVGEEPLHGSERILAEAFRRRALKLDAERHRPLPVCAPSLA